MIPQMLALGSTAPDFDLLGVDGKMHALASFSAKPVLVVIFSCNHCPYVKDYEDRMVAIQRDYASRVSSSWPSTPTTRSPIRKTA